MCYTFCLTRPAMRDSPLVHAMANKVLEQLGEALLHFNVNADLIGNIFRSFGFSYYYNVKFYEKLAGLICSSDLELLDSSVITSRSLAVTISELYTMKGIKHEGLIRMIERNITGKADISVYAIFNCKYTDPARGILDFCKQTFCRPLLCRQWTRGPQTIYKLK